MIADINNDGNTDIVFQSTGSQPGIMVWTLNYQNHTFERTGTQNLSEVPPAPIIIGAADVNGDGHTDITFWNPDSGAVISWLLNASNPWSPIGCGAGPRASPPSLWPVPGVEGIVPFRGVEITQDAGINAGSIKHPDSVKSRDSVDT